jgi:hypothetical protein
MSESKPHGAGELDEEQLADVSGGAQPGPPELMEEAGIVSPRDSASGLPTGKRQHKPIVITKELDKSSPLLFQG